MPFSNSVLGVTVPGEKGASESDEIAGPGSSRGSACFDDGGVGIKLPYCKRSLEFFLLLFRPGMSIGVVIFWSPEESSESGRESGPSAAGDSRKSCL